MPLEGSLPTVKWRLDGATTEAVFGWKLCDSEEILRGLIAEYLELA